MGSNDWRKEGGEEGHKRRWTAKGAAATVAAEEEVAREEAAEAEETVSGTCVVRQGASRRP